MVKTEKKADKKPRGDKIRNRAKIIKEVLKDPTQSQRAIAKKIGIGKTTVKDHLKELEISGELHKIKQRYNKKVKEEFENIFKGIDLDIYNKFVDNFDNKSDAIHHINDFMFVACGLAERKRRGISAENRYYILHQFGFKCCACGAKPQSDNDVELHIDHIVPYSMGGICDKSNYQVLCMKCNISKKDNFTYDHRKDG